MNIAILKKILLYCLLLTGFAGNAQESSQRINTDWDHERHIWDAWWITHPAASRLDYGVFHFRKYFEISELPDSLIIYVSADNRYRLWINGKPTGMGPARGSTTFWRYEKYDIAPFLHKGKNLIAAQVFNLGLYRPVAQFSSQTAFILQAQSPYGNLLNTGNDWKVFSNEAYNPIPVTSGMVKGYFVAGPCDSVDGKMFPWGWERPFFNDNNWVTASRIIRGTGRGYMHGVPWNLVPRTIPAMEETPFGIRSVVRSNHIDCKPGILEKSPFSYIVKPNDTLVILFDQQTLTTAYPRLNVSGGLGSRIKITYAESLYDMSLRKGNRAETDGKNIIGYYDIFMPGGQDSCVFSTLWMRTWRYLQLEVITEGEPLAINNVYGIFTAYPFKLQATFQTADPKLTQIWNTGWTTARLCANETYMDCPYYEQLQYLGDTRIQALISFYLTGDDRLIRNALKLADESRIPEGLTLARGPSYIPQITPPFSLYWIDMLHDYYMYSRDDGFLRQFLPGIRSVLEWFEQRLGTNDLLGPLEWFNFTDWTPGFQVGAPAGVDTGSSALITLNYVYALKRAEILMEHFGQKQDAARYRELHTRIGKALIKECFDPQKGLFSDTPEKIFYSQHTNIFAILCDLVPEPSRQLLMTGILKDTSLIQTTTYYKFYLFEALRESGLGNEYLNCLQPWEEMLKLGLTTFREDDYEDRSDCHAWSASPCYHFLSLVCGIRPLTPGFRSVEIAPCPGNLTSLKSSMPHPAGSIALDLHFNQNSVEGKITLPDGTEGVFVWQGQRIKLHEGKQEVKLNPYK
jgi:alpha-L-rhamnosidase